MNKIIARFVFIVLAWCLSASGSAFAAGTILTEKKVRRRYKIIFWTGPGTAAWK